MRPLLIALCAVLLFSCGRSSRPVTLLAGHALGGEWTVRIAGPLPIPEQELRAGIQRQFDVVDAALGSRPDSGINRLNAARGQWQELEPELFEVLRYALEMAHLSHGVFNPTLGPAAPDHWREIALDVMHHRARLPEGLRLDLSALEKGRGVDRVAWWLREYGVDDFLVEVTGRLFASGRNGEGGRWRVAVEKPAGLTAGPDDAREIVYLDDQAIATDGHQLQWTVIARECMVADAWATLFTLLPRQQAIVLANRYSLAALLTAREDESLNLRSARWQPRQQASLFP